MVHLRAGMAEEPAPSAAVSKSEPGKAASRPTKPKPNAVKYIELFRYATFTDKIALGIALLAALINGGIFRESGLGLALARHLVMRRKHA